MPGTFPGAGDTAVSETQPSLLPCSSGAHFDRDRDGWTAIPAPLSPGGAHSRTLVACPAGLRHGQLHVLAKEM